MTDLLIIGGGMAGLTAAIYALRAGKSVLLTEKETFGGQITSAPRVENYPGMPGVSGNQLTDAALSQALDLGLEIELEDITSLHKLEDGSFIASTSKREYAAKAVILATGAKHRPLGVAREEELTGQAYPTARCVTARFTRARMWPWWAAATVRRRQPFFWPICAKALPSSRISIISPAISAIWTPCARGRTFTSASAAA